MLFGGCSPEHDVSCYSAAGVISGINTEKYNIHRIGITKDGRWIYTESSSEKIGDAVSWESEPSNRPCVVSPDRDTHGIIVFGGGSQNTIRIDIAFPVLHGENGEDGTVQGLFELAGIPYVGCDVCSSACSMDKAVTNRFAAAEGLRCPRCISFHPADFRADPEKTVNETEEYHGGVYPVVVKPSRTGSSIGVTVAENREELLCAMNSASVFSGRIMVEEFIKGREIKVAVLGTEPVTIGTLCETVIENKKVNDYELKYKSNGTHKKIPPEIDEAVAEKIRNDSVRIFKALGCAGLARVDFFLKGDEVYFNEINTIPGLSRHSIFSLMLEKSGVSYESMIEFLLDSTK